MADKRERWAIIDEFPDYAISTLGRVKSFSRLVATYQGMRMTKERILKIQKGPRGYSIIGLLKDKKHYSPIVHRLVAKAFIPNPENKATVNHINFDITDNRVENLEWCTQKENNLHSQVNNRKVCGEKSHFSRLRAADVFDIRRIYSEDKLNQYEIADIYGVCQSTVWKIVNNKKWVHLKKQTS